MERTYLLGIFELFFLIMKDLMGRFSISVGNDRDIRSYNIHRNSMRISHFPLADLFAKILKKQMPLDR